jgi:hypothetical protein
MVYLRVLRAAVTFLTVSAFWAARSSWLAHDTIHTLATSERMKTMILFIVKIVI